MARLIKDLLYAHLGGTNLGPFRIGGPGLGNMLMPWARCMLAARAEGLPVIAPTWPQLKVGPMLRGEPDLRSYVNLFSKQPDEIDGFRKALALGLGTRVDETGVLLRQGLPTLRLRVFSGMGAMFGDLQGHARLLREELMARVRPAHVPVGAPTPFGIHVRCGDFQPLAGGQIIAPEGVRSGERVPIHYYVRAVKALRTVIGTDVAATVYSDGTDDELSPLLALASVSRAPSNSALFDMLAMSQHRVLLGSPHSTFSMWAAFLGQIHYMTFPEAKRDYGVASVILQADVEKWIGQLGESSVTRRLVLG